MSKVAFRSPTAGPNGGSPSPRGSREFHSKLHARPTWPLPEHSPLRPALRVSPEKPSRASLPNVVPKARKSEDEPMSMAIHQANKIWEISPVRPGSESPVKTPSKLRFHPSIPKVTRAEYLEPMYALKTRGVLCKTETAYRATKSNHLSLDAGDLALIIKYDDSGDDRGAEMVVCVRFSKQGKAPASIFQKVAPQPEDMSFMWLPEGYEDELDQQDVTGINDTLKSSSEGPVPMASFGTEEATDDESDDDEEEELDGFQAVARLSAPIVQAAQPNNPVIPRRQTGRRASVEAARAAALQATTPPTPQQPQPTLQQQQRQMQQQQMQYIQQQRQQQGIQQQQQGMQQQQQQQQQQQAASRRTSSIRSGTVQQTRTVTHSPRSLTINIANKLPDNAGIHNNHNSPQAQQRSPQSNVTNPAPTPVQVQQQPTTPRSASLIVESSDDDSSDDDDDSESEIDIDKEELGSRSGSLVVPPAGQRRMSGGYGFDSDVMAARQAAVLKKKQMETANQEKQEPQQPHAASTSKHERRPSIGSGFDSDPAEGTTVAPTATGRKLSFGRKDSTNSGFGSDTGSVMSGGSNTGINDNEITTTDDEFDTNSGFMNNPGRENAATNSRKTQRKLSDCSGFEEDPSSTTSASTKTVIIDGEEVKISTAAAPRGLNKNRDGSVYHGFDGLDQRNSVLFEQDHIEDDDDDDDDEEDDEKDLDAIGLRRNRYNNNNYNNNYISTQDNDVTTTDGEDDDALGFDGADAAAAGKKKEKKKKEKKKKRRDMKGETDGVGAEVSFGEQEQPKKPARKITARFRRKASTSRRAGSTPEASPTSPANLNPAQTQISETAPTYVHKQGWLQTPVKGTLRRRQTMKLHWFVLQDVKLNYYQGQQISQTPLGTVTLGPDSKIQRTGNKRFSITDNDTLVLQAQSSKIVDEWITALQAITINEGRKRYMSNTSASEA